MKIAMTKAAFEELSKIVGEVETDDFGILAIPRTILNNDKPVQVITTTVYSKLDESKSQTAVYRGENSGYKEWLKRVVDVLSEEIFREIAKPKDKNSL